MRSAVLFLRLIKVIIMRFLCLHGMGTSSRILESQIAGICAQLEGHDFVFADGEVKCDAADGVSMT